MPVDTAQFGQADLSKTETHSEAPMTQQGRDAAPGSIMFGLLRISPNWKDNEQQQRTQT